MHNNRKRNITDKVLEYTYKGKRLKQRNVKEFFEEIDNASWIYQVIAVTNAIRNGNKINETNEFLIWVDKNKDYI